MFSREVYCCQTEKRLGHQSDDFADGLHTHCHRHNFLRAQRNNTGTASAHRRWLLIRLGWVWIVARRS